MRMQDRPQGCFWLVVGPAQRGQHPLALARRVNAGSRGTHRPRPVPATGGAGGPRAPPGGDVVSGEAPERRIDCPAGPPSTACPAPLNMGWAERGGGHRVCGCPRSEG